MWRLTGAVGLAVALTLAVALPAGAQTPIRTFAPSNCYHTVFAHTTGAMQYGFTSCTKGHRISLLVGNGSSWRRVQFTIRGTPLAAANNGELSYVLYRTSRAEMAVAWVGHQAAGITSYALPSFHSTILAGGVVATAKYWRAMYAETYTPEIWCAPNCYLVARYPTTAMSMAVINGRVVLASVSDKHLYVGTLNKHSTKLTHALVTSDEVGQPRVLSYRGHTAVAFPDYTTNTVRLAFPRAGRWVFKTLGTLGTADNAKVSAGWSSTGAVVAWQTPNGLRVARYVHGSWRTTWLSGKATGT